MTTEAFHASLSSPAPPAGLSPALLALWHDGRGDWAAAHHAVQDDASAEGAWVHAYLHRKEGDTSNAAYWYRRAGKPVAAGEIADDWQTIVAALTSG